MNSVELIKKTYQICIDSELRYPFALSLFIIILPITLFFGIMADLFEFIFNPIIELITTTLSFVIFKGE